jgi:hypothetical protein
VLDKRMALLALDVADLEHELRQRIEQQQAAIRASGGLGVTEWKAKCSERPRP